MPAAFANPSARDEFQENKPNFLNVSAYLPGGVDFFSDVAVSG